MALMKQAAGDLKKLVHDNFEWKGRCAPLSTDALYAPTWRERAEKHRSKLGLPTAGRPPIQLPRVADDPGDGRKQVGNDSTTHVPGDGEAHFVRDPLGELADDQEALKEIEPKGDLWQTAMRVELEMYLLYKSAKARLLADRGDSDSGYVPLETTTAWHMVLDISAAERDVLRYEDRSSIWPDILRPVSTLGLDEAKHFCQRLDNWITDLEELSDASSDSRVREALRFCPVAALLRQVLCDFYVDIGDIPSAISSLVGFGRTGLSSESSIDCNPAIAFWVQDLRCDYVKAHHHLRLGRLSLLAASSLRAESAEEAAREIPPNLLRCRDKAREAKIHDKAAKARKDLILARACFESELEYATLAAVGASLTRVDLELFLLALSCSRMQAVALLGRACLMLSRSEALALLKEAHHMACDVRRHPRATDQLRLLAIDEAYRLASCISEFEGSGHC